MIATLRVLIQMGALQRLLPFWLFGVALMVVWPSYWTPLVLLYGVVMQFFVEYLMHRFVLHAEPPTKQGPFNALYRSHIGHHEIPGDPEFFTGDDHWYPVRFGLGSIAVHTLVL